MQSATLTLRNFTTVVLKKSLRFGQGDTAGLGTLHQGCVKILLMIFYPFCPPYGRKFTFGTFHPETGKKLWKEILSTTGVKFGSAGMSLCICRVPP